MPRMRCSEVTLCAVARRPAATTPVPMPDATVFRALTRCAVLQVWCVAQAFANKRRARARSPAVTPPTIRPIDAMPMICHISPGFRHIIICFRYFIDIFRRHFLFADISFHYSMPSARPPQYHALFSSAKHARRAIFLTPHRCCADTLPDTRYRRRFCARRCCRSAMARRQCAMFVLMFFLSPVIFIHHVFHAHATCSPSYSE